MMRSVRLLAFALTTACIAILWSAALAGAAELRNLPEHVKFNYKSSGQVLFQTLSGKRVECAKVTGSGEFFSDRLGSAEFKFVGCENRGLGVKCTGLSDSTGGTITVSSEFHTRHLLPNSEGVNVGILVGHVHFSCSIALFLDLGCQASADLLSKQGGVSAVNQLLQTVYLAFSQANGDQKPVSIDTDSGLSMESCELSTKEGTGSGESTGLLGEGTIELFVNSKGESVTELIDLSGTF